MFTQPVMETNPSVCSKGVDDPNTRKSFHVFKIKALNQHTQMYDCINYRCMLSFSSLSQRRLGITTNMCRDRLTTWECDRLLRPIIHPFNSWLVCLFVEPVERSQK